MASVASLGIDVLLRVPTIRGAGRETVAEFVTVFADGELPSRSRVLRLSAQARGDIQADSMGTTLPTGSTQASRGWIQTLKSHTDSCALSYDRRPGPGRPEEYSPEGDGNDEMDAVAMAATVSCQVSVQQNQMSFFVASAGSGNGANLGGLAGADKICQTLGAAAGGKAKTWRAYLSAKAGNSRTWWQLVATDISIASQRTSQRLRQELGEQER